MEIYTRKVNAVRFHLPTPETTVNHVSVTVNNGDPTPLNPVPVEDEDVVDVSLPYLQNDGEAKVTWGFNVPGSGDFEETRTYQIVTPVLPRHEILEIHPHATEAEIWKIEKAVRHIIQSHTGQRFGKVDEVKKIRGSSSRKLLLPERLLSITDVDGGSPAPYEIEADGFILIHYPWGVPPVKADAWGLHYHTGGVIHNPNAVHLGVWNEQRTYNINGLWGWEEVPAAVAEAAKLLINDYARADQAYRDRWLTSMTAADWRIQFNAGAFYKTGNVRADQLLSEYVLKRGWAVL